MTWNALDEIRRQAKKNKREKEKTDLVDQIMFSFDKTDDLIIAGLIAQHSSDIARVCISMPHNPNPVLRRCVFTIKLSKIKDDSNSIILYHQINDPLRKEYIQEFETVRTEDVYGKVKMVLVKLRVWAMQAFEKYNTSLFSVSGAAVYVDQEGNETDGNGKPLGMTSAESEAWDEEQNKQATVAALENAKYDRAEFNQYTDYSDTDEALHRLSSLEKKMDLILDTLIKVLEKK